MYLLQQDFLNNKYSSACGISMNVMVANKICIANGGVCFARPISESHRFHCHPDDSADVKESALRRA